MRCSLSPCSPQLKRHTNQSPKNPLPDPITVSKKTTGTLTRSGQIKRTSKQCATATQAGRRPFKRNFYKQCATRADSESEADSGAEKPRATRCIPHCGRIFCRKFTAILLPFRSGGKVLRTFSRNVVYTGRCEQL